jgi:hypothetical protein
MNATYKLKDVQFEWDENKAQSNIQKHSVTFEEAAEVFFDPFYQIGDASANDEEERDFIIGYTFSQRLLLAVYTERREKIRIISVRPATRVERKAYENAN